MSKFTVCYSFSGSVTFDTNDVDEAMSMFDALDDKILLDELKYSYPEVFDVLEEEE